MPDQLVELIRGFEVQPVAFLDIALTALLIYGLLSLIRGTRAVRLVIGVSILYAVYVAAQILGLELLSQILQAAAVVGLLALVVVFQPELRRGLERIGRVGSLGWLIAPATRREYDRVSRVIAQAAATLSSQKTGALIVVERETGLTDTAESGVPIDAKLSPELLETIFTPRSALHDGAVIIRHDRMVSAGVVLPLSESGSLRERFGTRHRAALGISEQTDAVVVVVSEETGQIALVERGRIVRNMDEERLRRALFDILEHNTALSAARIPARANALRRNLPIRRPRRDTVATEGSSAGAGTAASAPNSPATASAPAAGAGASAAATTPGPTPSGRFE
ncbi:MAG TPA: diadenylate cyclase CdaA [Candidatus Limnocylindrales bacterium]|nr:diadenylate cyclase CdaA [Candidatus Limnocylindrales bacterium]